MKKRGQVVGVDIGGTNLRVGIVQGKKTGKMIRKKTPLAKGELLKTLFDMIDAVIDSEVKGVRGIGVSSPGPLKAGVIKNSPNMALKNFDLLSALKKRFKVRVEIENDAACVALAELKYGVGKGKKNFFVLTLGTGIGGGVVIDGKLYNARDYGGELGNICLDDGKSFEVLAGGRAIKRLTKLEFGNAMDISELIKLGNKKSKKLVGKIVEYYGQGIGSLINVFNPEVVVLAGGMREAGSLFLRLINKETGKYILFPGNFPVVWSKLEEPGLIGAGLLLD